MSFHNAGICRSFNWPEYLEEWPTAQCCLSLGFHCGRPYHKMNFLFDHESKQRRKTKKLSFYCIKSTFFCRNVTIHGSRLQQWWGSRREFNNWAQLCQKNNLLLNVAKTKWCFNNITRSSGGMKFATLPSRLLNLNMRLTDLLELCGSSSILLAIMDYSPPKISQTFFLCVKINIVPGQV